MKEVIEVKKVIEALSELGGVDSKDEFFKGWDKAVTAAISTIENLSKLEESKLLYSWSENEHDELWQHGRFGSIEDCIADAKENYEMKPGDTIAVGECFIHEVYVDANDVLEILENEAYENCGEAAEGWVDRTGDQEEELSEALTECVRKWLKKTGNEPKFWHIDSVRTITIPE